MTRGGEGNGVPNAVAQGSAGGQGPPREGLVGGEEAEFFAGWTFGVFDGVLGAAKERGKKLYSRCLVDTMKKSIAGRGRRQRQWGGREG